jgi:hypothetical protein
MSAITDIDSSGGSPQVTVSGSNLIRYSCSFRLWKPVGEIWPETNKRHKLIHEVTLNQNHPPTDTFSLGLPEDLTDVVALTWDIDMIVPGGGGPLQYSVSVQIKQDGNQVMTPPWSKQGQITNVEPVSGDTELRVS